MDVSQVKNDIDSPLKWGITYKSDTSDDFARHLAEDDRDVDAYEPKEKVRSKERVDDDDDHIENDDPAEKATDQDLNSTTTAVVVIQTPLAPVIPVNPAGGDTAVTQTATSAVTPGTSKPDVITPADMTKAASPELMSAAQNTEATAEDATEAAATKEMATATEPKTQQAVTTAVAGAAAAAQQKKSTSDAPADIKVTASTTETKSVVTEQTDTQKTQAPVNTLEKLRTDEMAKMSEKDALSSKISELLAKGKGKITTSAAGTSATGATAQSSLVSANNTMVAATSSQSTATPAKTDTAIGMVTQNAQTAEMPIIIPNGDLAASLLTPQATGDTNLSTTTVVPGGAINGIDSTSTSSVSQASLASRASAQAGSPAEQVATQILNAGKDGVDLIKVQLNPAELGRIDIKLEMGQDGRILAVISADNQNSLDLLQQDSKHLEKALQDAGFDTGSDSLSFSLNQGNAEEGADQGMSSANTAPVMENDEDMLIDPVILSDSSSPNSGLDIQV